MIRAQPLVLISAVLACVLSGCGEKPAVPAENVIPVHKPTQILKNFEMNDTRNGIKTMTLKSIEGRIYESQNYSDVDQPILFFYKNGQVSSRLHAPAGRVQIMTHQVEMWGGVTVVGSDSSTLTTEHLNYEPKTQRIYSKDAVHLEKTDSVTDGIGLETDPELKRVRIGHQKVRFKNGVAK